MQAKPLQMAKMVRYLGPQWAAFRARYALEHRLGSLERRMPAGLWSDWPIANALTDPALADPDAYLELRRSATRRFLFAAKDRAAFRPRLLSWDADAGITPIPTADSIGEGVFPGFDRSFVRGFPPDWHANALTGEIAPANIHWTHISDFGFGDIKYIWETNRFGFVYPLVRAYWRTGDERYPAIFWHLLEDWRHHNQPNVGPNWKCGQETSLRLMAWCFALHGFLDSPETTPIRVQLLAQMVAFSGHRIAGNLRYALSQRNNHGVSEGMGLWTIGVLFPELRAADEWRFKGRQVLESLAQDLIYDDGAFSQHSTNYHRLMLQDYTWALRIGDTNGAPLSQQLRDRVFKAAELLYQLQDDSTGETPHLGANDGALVLPLSNSAFWDMRPAIQSAIFATHGERRYPAGPWDEALLWTGGESALKAPPVSPPRTAIAATQGGYYTLRSEESLLFVHCADYHDRPSHADQLHIDLWWRGHNILVDAGTYSYNSPQPWTTALPGAACHNTITVDNTDQMERAGRFLWLPWAKGQGKLSPSTDDGRLDWVECSHDGYMRLTYPVLHRRAVVHVGHDSWLVIDDLVSEGPHTYRLHWLAAASPYRFDEPQRQLALETPSGEFYIKTGILNGAIKQCTVLSAENDAACGWQAIQYGDVRAVPAFICKATGSSVRLWSYLGPDQVQIERCQPEMVELVTFHGKISLQLGAHPSPLILRVNRTCTSS